MTILKSTRCLSDLTHTAVHPEVAELAIRAAIRLGELKNHAAPRRTILLVPLRLLECYCNITGQRITMKTLCGPKAADILWGFAAVISTKSLVVLHERTAERYCRDLFNALVQARTEVPEIRPVKWDAERYWVLKARAPLELPVTPRRQVYWDGFPINVGNQEVIHVRLRQIVHSHGLGFAQRIHEQLQRDNTGSSKPMLPMWNQMFDFLASNGADWPERVLRTENGVRSFMHTYAIHKFKEAKKADKDPQSQITRWAVFVNSVERCLCQTGVWATLTSPIVRPAPNGKQPWETKTRELEDGVYIQEKLLTAIPLNVTDSEAMELLFFHIRNDISVVRKWAEHEAADLKARHANRVKLAEQGTAITLAKGVGLKKLYSMADICATLEDDTSNVPPKFMCAVYEHLTGIKLTASELAELFGFPKTGALFAHQILLVLEHPQITSEALLKLELYNQQGAMTGFDAELKTLTMYKNRKGSESREQIIQLTDATARTVQEIIDITSILRRRTRSKGDDLYRYLFISSSRGFVPIRRCITTTWSPKTFKGHAGLEERIMAQFEPHCDLGASDLADFITKVRLTRVRVSRAVENYLTSRDPEEMSRTLGHENYHPDLLGHYLPECILGFIKARWIRIFQKNIICEAMKNSRYLLRATQFSTMDELHLFLENHSFEIPLEASDPRRNAQKQKAHDPEAVLSVSVPFLASLLSLEIAVNTTKEPERLCGKAVYWSVFADKLKAVITGGHNRTLKKHLENALKLVDPSKMGTLIYV